MLPPLPHWLPPCTTIPIRSCRQRRSQDGGVAHAHAHVLRRIRSCPAHRLLRLLSRDLGGLLALLELTAGPPIPGATRHGGRKGGVGHPSAAAGRSSSVSPSNETHQP